MHVRERMSTHHAPVRYTRPLSRRIGRHLKKRANGCAICNASELSKNRISDDPQRGETFKRMHVRARVPANSHRATTLTGGPCP